MISKLSKFVSYMRFNRFIALSVQLTETGFEVSGCELFKNNDNLCVDHEFRFFNDFSELKASVSGSFPVFIVIDGKGVLHKKLAVDRANEPLAAFPDIDPKAFYIQKSSHKSENSFVSVCRKETLDNLLKELSHSGFNVLSCALGPLVINAFLDLIGIAEDTIHLGYSVIRVDRTGILAVTRAETFNQDAVSIQSEHIGADVLACFCLAIGYFSGNLTKADTLNFPELSQMGEEVKFKRRYYKLIGFGVVGAFLVLLINFFVYSSYASDLERLEEDYYQNSKMIKQLQTLEADFERERLFLENNELLDHFACIPFCDQLGASVPEDIVLEKIEVNPILGKIRSGKRVKYLKGVAVVEGLAEHDNSLSRWVQRLGEEDWVLEVIIEKYSYENDGNLCFVLRIELGEGGLYEEL